MKKINFKSIIVFAVAVGLLVFFHNVGWLRPAERALYFVFNPVSAKLHSWSSGFSVFLNNQIGKTSSAEEKLALKNKIEILTAENASLKKTEEENRLLRQYLKFFKEHENFSYVLANIVSRNSGAKMAEEREDLVIDKGRSDGLFPGLAAVNEQGVVVGKILSCEESVCHLAPIADPDCQLAAALQNGGKTIGVAAGNQGLTVNLDFIPQLEKIAVGDLAVTSGLESNIPRGLVIGRVSKVDKGSNEIWQKAIIEPLADLSGAVIVSVIRP